MKRARWKVGPCRDPLRLWYLEDTESPERSRWYFANRQEARAEKRRRDQATMVQAQE